MIDKIAIEELLKSKISGDQIQEQTGVRKEAISKYRNGKTSLDNMTLDTAEKLTDFWNSVKNKPEKDIKIKGLKKAVGEFNNWQGAAIIYFDKINLEVWTTVYAGPGSWDEYNDPNIFKVFSKATVSILERDDSISMRKLREICLDTLEE